MNLNATRVQVFLVSILLISATFIGEFRVEGSSHHHKHHRKLKHDEHSDTNFGIEKLFVFGDSYADTGNVLKMWQERPYGITFPGKPHGRYSDGRILTDYVAEYLGLKHPVPYKLRTMHKKQLHYGMNFAFGGAGVFKTLFAVPNISTQVDYFEELIKESVYTAYDLENSLALVTLSGNDYSAFLAKNGSITDLFITFIPSVVNELSVSLRRVSEFGVKRIAVGSLPPLGCVPFITESDGYKQCNPTDNMGSDRHNTLLTASVAQLNKESLVTEFGILNLDEAFSAILKNNNGDPKEKLKLATPLKPCCQGVAASNSCGDVDANGEKMYTVCENPESAFFWDSVHPTQAGWQATFSALEPNLKEICEFE